MSANSKAGAPTRKMTPQPSRARVTKQTPEPLSKAEAVVAPAEHNHDHDHDSDHVHTPAKPKPRPTLAVFQQQLSEAKELTGDLRSAMTHLARSLEEEAARGKPRTAPMLEVTTRLRGMVGSFTEGSVQKKLQEELDAFADRLREALS